MALARYIPSSSCHLALDLPRSLPFILGLQSIAVLMLFSDGDWIQLIIDDVVIFCLAEVIPYAGKLQRSEVGPRSWALTIQKTSTNDVSRNNVQGKPPIFQLIAP